MNTSEVSEEEIEETNVLPFAKPIPKPGGAPPSDGDWLSKLGHNTRFLCRYKAQKTMALADFVVASPRVGNKNAVVLGLMTHQGLVFDFYDSVDFSKNMEFYDVIDIKLPIEEVPENGPEEHGDG